MKTYSVQETAEILKVTRQTVGKLINDGVLPAGNIGTDQRREYRISEAGLNAFLGTASVSNQVGDNSGAANAK